MSASDGSSAQPDAGRVLEELRSSVRETIDEWLSGRSNAVALAISQIVQDALVDLQRRHATQLADLQTAHEARVASLESEKAEAVRSARRKRRAVTRATEKVLRERIERLEASLMAASLEGVERLREVERREAERREELEQSMASRLRQKDEEIERLGSKEQGDRYYDSLRDQLLSRRPERQH